MTAFVILAIIIFCCYIYISFKEREDFSIIAAAMFLCFSSLLFGIVLVYDTGADKTGALKLYKGEYKIEIQHTYVDSLLVKSDTLVIDLKQK